ncbi:MAG: RHS repeat-associated core domain-containing protein [Candidatus Omnitrophota bacterium]
MYIHRIKEAGMKVLMIFTSIVAGIVVCLSPPSLSSFAFEEPQEAQLVLGQLDFTTNDSNYGGLSASSLSRPGTVSTDGVHLYVADYFNNRVLIYNNIPATNNQPADVVIGQPDFTSNLANNGNISSQSLWGPMAAYSDGERLYVADHFNHRVLIYNSIPTENFAEADIVLGQPDFTSNLPNNGGVTSQSLLAPTDVHSDGVCLYVTDAANNRVLIYNSIPTENFAEADIVLGQPDFTSNLPNNGGVTSQSLWGVARVFSDGIRVYIADQGNHRVLIHNQIPTNNFQPADIVLGQPNFSSNVINNGGVSASSFYVPFAVYSNGESLFVADQANNRILLYAQIPTENNQSADAVLGQLDFSTNAGNFNGVTASSLSGPISVYGDGTWLYVADGYNNRALVYSEPIVLDVVARLFARTGNRYTTGKMIKIEVRGNFDLTNITSGSIRITSNSHGYDSGVQNLTMDYPVFYQWDTTDLNPGKDYTVDIELTDFHGRLIRDSSLVITLMPNPSPDRQLVRQIDFSMPAQGISVQIERVYTLYSGYDKYLGYGWTHTYLMHVVETSDGLVEIFNANGTGSFFKPKAPGEYESSKGDFRILTKNADGTYLLTEKYGKVFYFNRQGKLTRIEDRNGNALVFLYDPDNRLKTITDTSGQITFFYYDENNRVTSIEGPFGQRVWYEYDQEGNLSAVTDIGGFKTTYAYDQKHNLILISDPCGRQTFFTIYEDGRLKEYSNEEGNNRLFYEYSELSHEKKVTDNMGRQTRYIYNNNGLIICKEDTLGNISERVYDNNSNLVSTRDANGNQIFFTYDNRGNILTKTDAQGNVTVLTYEAQYNQISSITTPRGNTTSFAYDSNGNLITVIYPDGSRERYRYDDAGNLVRKTDRNGQKIKFCYTPRGKLREKIFPDGRKDVFSYDNYGNLIRIKGRNGVLRFKYDRANRLSKVTCPGKDKIRYRYDKTGNLTQLVYPDGTKLEYVYDDVNRLIQINSSSQTIAAYTYDAMSRVIRKDLQHNVYTEFSYDFLGRLGFLVNRKSNTEIISSFAYTYDAVGNRLTMITPEGLTEYVYDNIYQLSKVISPDGELAEYTHDQAGNRLTLTKNGDTTTYTTNMLNQYTNIDEDVYTYDNNGNLIEVAAVSGITTFAYDFENQLIRVNTPGEIIKYVYDPLGRRTSKITPAAITEYIHDQSRVILEKDKRGVVQATYVYGRGIDEILVMKRNGTDYFYCYDGMGSVTNIIDKSENVVESFSYDAYGVPNKVSSIGNPYLFTGREYEPEAGLYYYRARYYSPAIGRFLSPDPIGFEGGMNFYSYVKNNPVNFTDPSGLFDENRFYYDVAASFVGGFLASGDIFGGIFAASWTVMTYAVWEIAQNIPEPDYYEGPVDEPMSNITIDQNRDVSCGEPTFIQCIEKRPQQHKAVQKTNGLIAKISVPFADALVRAKVPIFGVAYGEAFREYRVDYGQGDNPREWVNITTSTIPQLKDTAPVMLDDSSDQTIYGNLATFDTGLKNYTYGDEYQQDHPIDLAGVYTIRLLVTNIHGAVAEDRVTVEVGRVIPNIYGGKAISTDGMVVLDVPEHALREPFRIITIKPLEDETLPFPEEGALVGKVYEMRPAGESFTRDATLGIKLPEDCFKDLSTEKLGIYAFNSQAKQWEYLPAFFDKAANELCAYLHGLPHGNAYFAVFEGINLGTALSRSRYAADKPAAHQLGLSKKSINSKEKFLIANTFEQSIEQWTNRNSDVGADLTLEQRKDLDSGYCLKLTNKNHGGNFASTIFDLPFNAKEYPTVRFDYKIPKQVNINFLVKMDERWYEIEFTDAVKEYKRLNMERIGQIENVIVDNKWHTAGFNLYALLQNYPPIVGRDNFVIQEMVMADWDAQGYMKLVYGKNKKGATYYIDNFIIEKDKHPPEKPVAKKDALLVAGFEHSLYANGLGPDAGLFQKNDFHSKISTAIEHDSERGPCLKLTYDVSEKDDYAGYYKLLRNIDLSAYRTLCFWIKGEIDNPVVQVGLMDKHGHEDKILVGSYLTMGITNEWQKVSIPLAGFSTIEDFSSLENINFTLENRFKNSTGVIFIDDITFEMDVVPLIAANCSDGAGRNVWGRDCKTFKTNNARINAFYDQLGSLLHYADIFSSRDKESWAGWIVDLNNIDVCEYPVLSFKFKRVHGSETPNVYLDDGTTRKYINLEQYLKSSTQWEKVRIPLRDFAVQGVDLRCLKNISFVFEWSPMSAGAVYVDKIMFEPLPF